VTFIDGDQFLPVNNWYKCLQYITAVAMTDMINMTATTSVSSPPPIIINIIVSHRETIELAHQSGYLPYCAIAEYAVHFSSPIAESEDVRSITNFEEGDLFLSEETARSALEETNSSKEVKKSNSTTQGNSSSKKSSFNSTNFQ
jgi:flavin reductase (DIM6/NTAB) family NADH-FMN oxidoreductase RutF